MQSSRKKTEWLTGLNIALYAQRMREPEKTVVPESSNQNSDRESAYLEGNEAVKRAILSLDPAGHPDFINAYYGLNPSITSSIRKY